MVNSVLAFAQNSNEDRTLRIEYSINNSKVIANKDMDARINVRFTHVTIEHDEDTYRPYIMFRDGEVKGVSGQFPYGVENIRFKIGKRPPVEVRWDLSNEEITELVEKGLYGYGPNKPKAREKLQVPDVFTEADFENIPCKVDVYATSFKEDTGKIIPIISCSINSPYECRTNSEDTEYGNIVSYFDKAKQEFVPHNNLYYSQRMDEREIWGYESKEEDKIIRAERIFTREEEEENKLRALLASEVSTRRDERETSIGIDRIITDSDVAVDILVDDEKMIPADEEMSDEELEILHLTENNEDKKRAKQKIAEEAMRKAVNNQIINEQQEQYVRESNIYQQDLYTFDEPNNDDNEQPTV